MTDAGADTFTVSTAWVGVHEAPLLVANQFVLQLGSVGPEGTPEECFLTVGQVAPPVLLGTEEEQLAQAEQAGAVPIRTLARYSLSRGRAAELARALEEVIQRYDAASATAE